MGTDEGRAAEQDADGAGDSARRHDDADPVTGLGAELVCQVGATCREGIRQWGIPPVIFPNGTGFP